MTFINIPNSFKTSKCTGGYDMKEITLASKKAERTQLLERSCSKKVSLKCPQILDNLNSAREWRLSYLDRIWHTKPFFFF